MASIGLWCTVSQQEYPLLAYTMKGLIEHAAVRFALIVHTGAQQPSCTGMLTALSSKVWEVHRDFGQGYLRSLEQGGYDQISARNYALQLMENSGVDWLLQFDADDFYDPEFLSIVAGLDERYDAVHCPCYTLTSATDYWYEPILERTVGGIRLLNPHIRAWRLSLKKRFEPCLNSIKRYRNITRHCGVSFSEHPYWRFFIVRDRYHFHLHCVLGKRHAAARMVSRKLETPLRPELESCLLELRRFTHQED